MLDWISDFLSLCDYFEQKEKIAHLKEEKVHGNLNINFSDGMPVNVDFKQHFRKSNLNERRK